MNDSTHKRLLLVFGACVLLVFALLPKAADSHETVTTTVEFDREIVRILNRHCVMCHVDNGPSFPLVTYEQTYAQRRKMRMDALDRHMSPWSALSGYGDFANDNSLTQREIDFIVSWAEGWGPRNSGSTYVAAAEMKVSPKTIEAYVDFDRWQLGKPDLLLPLAPSTIEPQQEYETRRTVIDTKLSSDHWLRGLEYKPGDHRVAHAAFFTVQETGQWIGSWTPWYGFSGLPNGTAYRLPAGSNIIAEVAYRGMTTETVDRATLGLFFADHAPQAALSNLTLKPKPNPDQKQDEAATPTHIKFTASAMLAAETNIVSLFPQLRPGVQSVEVDATNPAGIIQVLLFAKDFDIEWPTPYILKNSVSLAKGSRLSVTEYYSAGESSAPAKLPAPEDIPVSISAYSSRTLPSQKPASTVPSQSNAGEAAAKHYSLTGTVKSVDLKDGTLVVEHGAIPGLMPPMTMQYPAEKREDLKNISSGDQIQADLVVQGASMRLANIKVIAK